MTFKEQQARYRRKLQRSAKLVERIAKLSCDDTETGTEYILRGERPEVLEQIIMDARNIIDGQEV